MILDKILNYKKEELEHFKHRVPLDELKARVGDLKPPLSLAQALAKPPASFAILAEIKKKSPSKGVIREDFDPVGIARDYAAHGAAALSVLTDEHFFGGHLDHLRSVRSRVELPLLRKDFLWEAYQIYAAREAGADAVLLIAAMLEQSQMEDLQGMARELGLSVLVEVHDAAEAESAVAIGAEIVGVNNRDLRSFHVDVATSEHIFPRLPKTVLKVSESGIDSHAVLLRLQNAGADAFLIGEFFMKSPSPGRALAQLLKGEL